MSRRDHDYPQQSLGGSSREANRFADAMGISSSTRARHAYDDLDYGVSAAPRSRGQRVIYRNAAPRQVARRFVDREYYDSPREVVQIVERVRRPQRRVQVRFLLFGIE